MDFLYTEIMNAFVNFQVDPNAGYIVQRLREAGHEAYFVGGCVRDFLLGRQPKDWDIATSAHPEQIPALFQKTRAVGKSFGVMLVIMNGQEYEVATFRGESEYSDGRRPKHVHFTDAREDARRRDFTINALMYDPFQQRVIDFVGGQKDLEQCVVRTVGEPRERFLEDHLRLLRAVRFAAKTGFTIDPATHAAIRELAGLVMTVSPERVGQEAVRMLTEEYACRAFELLTETGLLIHVLPEVARMQGVPQPPQFHPEGDVLEHTLLMLKGWDETVSLSAVHADPDAPNYHLVKIGSDWRLRVPEDEEREILGWTVLLHDVGKPETISYSDRIRFNEHDTESARIAEVILERLRRPKRIQKAVIELIAGHMKFSSIKQMREAKRRRLLQNALFPLHLELHRLDCLGSHSDLQNYTYALSAWLEELNRQPPVEPLLTGHDLQKLGYKPGPRMGEIIHALDDARLEGKVSSVDEAVVWVLEQYPLLKDDGE